MTHPTARRTYALFILALAAGGLAPQLAGAAYVDAVLADNPVGYWRFEETSGTQANDSSGNTQHGTYGGAVGLGAAGAASIGGNAASFSNVAGSGVDLPGTWGGVGVSELTIEAWVNVAGSTGGFQAIVSADTTNEFAHFQMFPGGGTGPYTDAGFVNLSAPTISPTGQWRHLALVAESGNTRLYENGVQLGSAAATAFTNILAGDNVDIGRGFAGGRNFNGLIDEVAIYETALSQTQVRNHINAATDGLLGHYTFDVDGTDSSFQAHHGTLGGGATITSDARTGTGALDLRGVNGFVDVVDPILSGHDQYTIAMWVNAEDLSGGLAGLFANDGFAPGVIHVNLNGAVGENAVAGTFPSYTQTGPLAEDEWVHLAFAYDSDSGMTTPYVNGIALSPTAHLPNVPAGLGATTIGAWDTNGLGAYSRYFDGRIDDLRVYGRLLSGDEVFRLVNGVPEPSTLLLVGLGSCLALVRRRRGR